MVELVVFLVASLVTLVGALGVVFNQNPVHAALSLVATLFGIAVLFVAQDADFLAAVQVIVYAGAIVVLFLFVIMLLGVDQAEDLSTDPLTGQRPAALVAGVLLGGAMVAVLVASSITGIRSSGGRITADVPNVNQLAKLVFTDYLFAFEITSVLLVIAVVGAVVLARRRKGGPIDSDEAEVIPLPGAESADQVEVGQGGL